jgi:Fe-S oxidoreductase
MLFSGPDAPDEAELYSCVHCGFCLQACPTYLETGLETESPRGRIALMKAVNEGRIGMTPSVVRHWDLCIQCRACEVACPSGVPYGRLIEATMAQVEGKRNLGRLTALMSKMSLEHLVPKQRRLELLGRAARFYQRSGLQSAVRKSRLLRALAPSLADLEQSLPAVSSTIFRAQGQVIPPRGRLRARVALLSGCVMPLVSGSEMNAAVRVLARNGVEVVVPKDQACCGAINSHMGDLVTARDLARSNVDAFLDAGVDAVVVASAGCGARMKEYDHLLRDDPDYRDRARRLSDMVKDIHEFLVELPFEPPKARLDYRVTYQDSCHLSNAQRVTGPPRQLLMAIPGIDFVEQPGASLCCGAGGTYAITEREFSLKILATKMSSIRETSADVVATANPGCVLQLKYGALREEVPIEVKYVTDLLDEAYRKEQ